MNYTLRDPNGNVLLSVENNTAVTSQESADVVVPLAATGAVIAAFIGLVAGNKIKDKVTMRKIDDVCRAHPDCLALLQSRNATYLKQVESINKNLPAFLNEFKSCLPDSLDVKVTRTSIPYIGKAYDDIAKNFASLKRYSKSTLAMYNDPYLKKPMVFWVSSTPVANVIEKPTAASAMDAAAAGLKAAGSLASAISSALGYEKVANVADATGSVGSRGISNVANAMKTPAGSVDLIKAQECLIKFAEKQAKLVPDSAVAAYYYDETSTLEVQVGLIFNHDELHTTLKPLIDVVAGKNKII